MSELAINGGPRTVTSLHSDPPKIGLEELAEILDLWPLSPGAKEEIGRILDREEPGGPHMFRYYHPTGESIVAKAEREFCDLFGCKHALAVNSGTSALIAAYVACGVGPGTEVIVPGFTFFATAAAVVTARAIPVIAEIDESLTIDPDDIVAKITPQTKAIAPVHMRGYTCDMEAIMEIAREHNLMVIEDCAQADGAWYKGKRLGTWGHCGCFSFDAYKLMSSGEGGMVCTDDQMLHTRAASWHDTAACWRPDRYARERVPGELFCGENYRLSEIQGAIVRVQLRKIDATVNALVANRNRVRDAITADRFPGLAMAQENDPQGGAGYNIAFFCPTEAKATEVIAALNAEGVPAGGVYDQTVRDWHHYDHWEHILEQKTATEEGCPYTCPYHKGALPEYSVDMCPKTLDYLARSVHLSVSAAWTAEDCAAVAAGVNKVAGELLG
jgi:8-amino-3,8-dideoxy-alpha-D-manno-octulosonate transaminase